MMDETLLEKEAPEPYFASTSHPPQGKGMLARYFYNHGVCVARNPIVAMVVSALAVGSMALGMTMLEISSNPQAIWVPPGTASSKQQKFFNNAFDPFYRVEQVIFTPRNISADRSSILENNVFRPELVQALQAFQEAMASTPDSTGTLLSDLCFKPIMGKGCLVESVTNFAADNATIIAGLSADSLQALALCRQPTGSSGAASFDQPPCMSAIGVPAMPSVVLGGSKCTRDVPGAMPDSVCSGGCQGRAAQAMMTTWLLNAGPLFDDKASRWEKEVFLPLARAFRHPDMEVTFMAQRSVQDEIEQVAAQNTWVVVISYCAMFAYIVLAMGKFPHPVRSRALVGFSGVCVVITCVASAMGLWAFAGGEITMIVTEVVPFLVLAIGVDNMFIITKTADRIRARRIAEAVGRGRGGGGGGATKDGRPAYDSGTPATVTSAEPPTPMPSDADGFVPVERLIGDALAEVGPTITAAAAAEALAFATAATTDIPALKQFCAVAAIAVSLDFLMQMTFFVAAVSLDFRRMDADLPDCVPCIVCLPCCRRPARGEGGWCGTGTAEATAEGDADRHDTGSFWRCVHRGEYSRTLLAQYIAPVTLSTPLRVVSIIIWLGFLVLSGYAATRLHLGLSQQLAVPQGSYLYNYFNEQAALGEAGPPAYIVLQNVNYSDADDVAKDSLSHLTNTLGVMTDHIVPPVYNWYSDFRAWSSKTNIDAMLVDGSTKPPFNCPLPLDPAAYSLPERIEQFLYDIPVSSPCCQRKAHCYSQYGPDVKLLWVVNRTLADAAAAAAAAAVAAAAEAEHPASAILADGAAAELAARPVTAGFYSGVSTAGDAHPWSAGWWEAARWQPRTADFPGTPGAPSAGLHAVTAGSRRDAVLALLSPGRAADAAPAPAAVAAAEAAEAWRVAGRSSAPSSPGAQLPPHVAEHLALGATRHRQAGPAAVAAALAAARSLAPVAVVTSRMRTVHTALRDQHDFVGAMQATAGAVHRLVDGIPRVNPADAVPAGVDTHADHPGSPGEHSDNQHHAWLSPAPVGPDDAPEAAFPYSLFYVYYDQYNIIRGAAVTTVLTALGAAFLAVLVVTSPTVAITVAVMVLTVTIDIVGIIWLLNPSDEGSAHALLSGVGQEAFGVDINAVSVVNLVTTVGLAVEFNVHIASHFAVSSGTRLVRAHKALSEMGSSVVTGITLTKLVGVMVLAWAPSQMFRLYYFRMYAAIIMAGAFQGLIVLPALLSWCGPASVHDTDYVEDRATGKRRARREDEYRGSLRHALVVVGAERRTSSEDSYEGMHGKLGSGTASGTRTLRSSQAAGSVQYQ